MAKPVPPDSPLNLSKEEIEKLPLKTAEDKAVLVSLHGATLTEEGDVVRNKYFQILGNTVDDYTDLQFTPDEANRVRLALNSMTHGLSSSIPVICTGPQCPWRSRCVYYQMDKAPLGRQCLIELNVLKQAQFDYLNEYEVSLDNRTEVSMIQELSEIEVLLHRANLNMAISPGEQTGITDVTIGFDNLGNQITQKQVSQNIELRERMLARRHKLVKLMVGDRQEKYKREAALKVREDKDPSSRMAEVREKLDNLSRQINILADGKTKSAGQLPPPAVDGKKDEQRSSEDSPLTPDDMMMNIQLDDNEKG